MEKFQYYLSANLSVNHIHSKNKGNMYSELKPPAYQQVVSLDAKYPLNSNILIGTKLVYEWGGLYGNNAGAVVAVSYIW
jgi:hypothetical protein